MTPVPILFLGDSPDLRTGLGRIGRDLAVRVASLPEFRVGYLGRGGHCSRQLPFAQYAFGEADQWGEMLIESVWADFASEERGIVMTIWDPSRLFWFACPENIPDAGLRGFLQKAPFQRWGYFPVDAQGPGGKLSTLGRETVRRYDRPLGYTLWGSQILTDSIGKEVTWLPHGVAFEVFQPRDRKGARIALGFKDGDTVIGCVMVNQARKDWGLAFSVVSNLRRRIPRLKFWCHVDQLERSFAWNLHALVSDFGVSDMIKITLSGDADDVNMSYFYSACDLVILPTLGEGFGYPVVEALGCGVPVVTGSYGGQAELVPDRSWLVEPVAGAWRLEGIHNQVRPVYNPEAFGDAILRVLDLKPSREICREGVAHLDWKLLWPSCWKKWFLEGITEGI